MFKSTADAMAFTHRVASHSTKPRPSGRVETLPPNAKDKELLYESYKAQFNNIKTNISRIDAELGTASCDRKYHLQAQRRQQMAELGRVASFARKIGEEAYTTVFYYLAYQRLPKELMAELDIETRCIMGRQRHEISDPSRKPANTRSLAKLPPKAN